VPALPSKLERYFGLNHSALWLLTQLSRSLSTIAQGGLTSLSCAISRPSSHPDRNCSDLAGSRDPAFWQVQASMFARKQVRWSGESGCGGSRRCRSHCGGGLSSGFFCSSRTFSAWLSGGFGSASGQLHRLRFWLLSRCAPQWPVGLLLSGLLFASLFASASETHHATIRYIFDTQTEET